MTDGKTARGGGVEGTVFPPRWSPLPSLSLLLQSGRSPDSSQRQEHITHLLCG